MSRVAILVDAGYLFAQGSAALIGEKQRRSDVKINATAAMAELTAVAHAKCPDTRLLRTYWYDAPPRTGMSAEHIALANTDYVKLRLGVLNGRGEQKGVDSLIVTDLIELARNKSICDAILLSGDEDVRIGVQIAQNFGVCVHLIGIHPARGSQSNLLRQESDTTTEWDKDVLARFMTVSAPAERTPRSPTPPSAAPAAAVVTGSGSVERTTSQDWSKIEAVIDEIVMGLDTSDLTELEAYWKTGAQGVPSDVDRPLLAKSRDAVGRVLSPEERRKARHLFASRAKDLIEKAS